MSEKQDYQDKQVLEHLYHEEGLSTTQIAEKFGVTQPTIYNWIDRHGISTRTLSDAQKERYKDRPVPLSSKEGYERWWYADPDGPDYQVYVHRLLAVAEFGLDSLRGKIVHHKNEIKWDNRPENLELITQSEHVGVHLNE